MPLLKKALGLSIIGITIVILAMSFYIQRKEQNPEWNNAITLQWIDSNEVPISELNNQTLSDLFEDFPEWSLNYQFEELNDKSLYEVFDDGNLVVNGDFSDGTTGWRSGGASSYTISDGLATLIGDGSQTTLRIYNVHNQTLTDDLYIIAKLKFNNNLPIQFLIFDGYTGLSFKPTNIDTFYTLSNKRTSSQLPRIYIDAIYSTSTIQSNSSFQVDYAYAINLTSLGLASLTKERLDYYFNIYQLMLQNESTDDIEFIQMLTDYAEQFNVTYEQMEIYYQNYYDNAYFNNQSIDISLDHYNFIEQGSGVIEAIYTPIVNMIDTITTISDRVTKFFGIKEQTTINYYDYSTLYEEFELNQIFGRKIYTYDISTSQQIQYSLDLNSYRLITYYMIFGVRVWEINSEVLTYARLDELNEIYEWIDVA
jgi:hypothetical protein